MTDPGAISDVADFARALTELRARAGLSIREVGRRTGIPSATLGGYFSGRHLPPPSQHHQLGLVLRELGVPDTELEDWRQALRRVRRVPGPRTPARAAPYRGLQSYRVEDGEWFFGREELVARTCTLVEELLDGPDGPGVVTLVGASGSGKSSLARAGLMCELEARGVRTALVVPGQYPRPALTAATEALPPAGPRRLLVVDQLEELLADAVTEGERTYSLSALTELAAEPATVVVLTLRADFYARAMAEPVLLPLLQQHPVLVGPLGREEFRRIVMEPAARAGHSVEPELVELVLKDVAPRGAAEASALPLLSHALLVTWGHAHGGRLTAAAYVAAGGLAGAVQRTAEEVYEGLDETGRQTARRLFSRLVNVDDDGFATRRRVHHADLEDDRGVLSQVVDAFVDGRILTATESTLEISHEALLVAWPRLGEWLAEDRDAMRVRRRVGQAARGWDEHGREPAGLMRGTLLQLAAELARTPLALSQREREFLEASLAHAEAEERVRRRRAGLLRTLFAGVAVLALVATLLSVYLSRAIDEANAQHLNAEEATARALSRQVAIQSSQLRDTAPALAMQLALAAYELSPTTEARSALLGSSGVPAASRLLHPEGVVRAVASPDGRLLATVASDGMVRLWRRDDAGSAPELVSTTQAERPGQLFAAAFSRDGSTLAVGGVEGVVTVLDVTDPASPVLWPEPLAAPGAGIQELSFSPDGRELYAAVGFVGAGGGELLRWRLGSGRGRPLPGVPAEGTVKSVVASAQGLVASGGVDGRLRVFRSEGRRLVPVRTVVVGTGTEAVHSVAFSPDGRLLAVAAADARVRVYAVATGRLVTAPLGGFPNWVNSVAFSSDGRLLAAAASGAELKVWRTRGWRLHQELLGSANYTSVQFMPGDDQLLTAGIDGVARVVSITGPRPAPFGGNIWGLALPESGNPLYVGVGAEARTVVPLDVSDPMAPRAGPALPRPPGVLDGVTAVSPDGRLVVAGTTSGDVVFWRLRPDGAASRPVVRRAAGDLVENAVFSVDGTRLVTAADDGRVTVFEVPPRGWPTVEQSLQIDAGALAVAISPDGSLIAAGDTDGLVHLWAAEDGRWEKVGALAGFDHYVYGAAFSPDGTMLAAGAADDTVRVWDVSGRPEPVGEPLRGPTDTVFSVSFDRSGDRLAAASADGRVWVWSWDGRRGTPYAQLDGLDTGLYQVVLHGGQDRVYAAGADGRLGSWHLDPSEVAAMVCRVAGAPITEGEWERYVPGAAYDPPCVSG